MAIFPHDLRHWIEAQGHRPAFADYVPDDPDSITAAMIYHTGSPAADGTLTRRVQIQVRRPDAEQAYLDAHALAEKLDSGADEDIIYLAPDRPTICRLTQAPRSFGRDGRGRATYYIEVAIWSSSTEP